MILRILLLTVVVGALMMPSMAQADFNPEERVAVQLYVFGQPAQKPGPDLEGVLETVTACGYSQIQAWLSYFDTEESAATLKEQLDRHGLRIPAAYTGAKLHVQEGAEAVIEEIVRKAKIGAKQGLVVVVVNPDLIGREKTDEELALQSENLEKLGGLLSKQGQYLAIHQHAPEMANGAREWYHILHHTSGDKVFFCLDTHWVLRGGQDPYQLTRDCADRLVDLHLRNSKEGPWAESFGEGDIDYRKVAEILKESGYRGLLTVELAHEKETVVTKSLEENLKASREYVREVFGE
jgi:inosose dehydratase